MEMESSRRPPFDRSRDLASLKKPRLAEDPRRVVAPNNAASAAAAALPGSGSGHQELVSQYKTALAELTFNSKPIITNLTIIAGENLPAARAIAATICSNILEVPSDQKLPSLYLLDSIVKNIGRDYIKYFATRLAEVFCKAYKQVEPSVHTSMRHLFGTWKGVFPPQPLQIIEKELGFSAAVNGPSSGSAASKTDTLSQRQSNSIHVNPKYLEARQRLQQTTRPKATDIGAVDVGSSEDVERPDRTAIAGTGRPWTDPSLKMHRPQREALREPSLQKQGGAAYGDYEFASGLTRPLTTSVGKPSERVIGQGYDKLWLGAGRGVEESISAQRNGFDAKRGNYTGARLASANISSSQIPSRNNIEVSKSWKNSEEEEYMWDDLGTRTTGPGAISVPKKDVWSQDEVEKLEFGSHLSKWQNQTEIRSSYERESSADTLSSEQKEQVTYGHPRSGSPLLQQVGARSIMSTSSVGVPGLGVPAPVGSTASVGQRYPSPGQSVMNQRQPSPSLSKRDPRLVEKSHTSARSDPRAASLSGQSNAGLRDKGLQNSLLGRRQNPQSVNAQKMQPQPLLKSSSIVPSLQQKQYVPSSEQLYSPESELSGVVQKAKQLLDSSTLKAEASSDISNPVLGDSQGQSNVSTLLAAVMKTGLLSAGSVLGQAGVQPAATAPPSSQSSFITSKGVTTSLGAHDGITTSLSQRKAEKRPLPSSPLISSTPTASSLTPTPSKACADSSPLSILSTLISKGLISAPKTEATASVPVESEAQFQEKSPTASIRSAVAVPSVPKSCAAPPTSTVEKISPSEPARKGPDTSDRSTKAEVEDPIGYEFRPPVLRQFHPVVIDRLSDDLPHVCTVCGLRFKLQEGLSRHSEWHAFKNSIPNALSTPSRRWYSTDADWIAGKAGFPFGYNSSCLAEGSSGAGEVDEKMVPADESQCVCLLCGELFEDFYSQERDEWMFKGAVYMCTSSESTDRGPSSESGVQNLIVHASCMSDGSVRDLGLVSGIKVEKDP